MVSFISNHIHLINTLCKVTRQVVQNKSLAVFSTFSQWMLYYMPLMSFDLLMQGKDILKFPCICWIIDTILQLTVSHYACMHNNFKLYWFIQHIIEYKGKCSFYYIIYSRKISSKSLFWACIQVTFGKQWVVFHSIRLAMCLLADYVCESPHSLVDPHCKSYISYLCQKEWRTPLHCCWGGNAWTGSIALCHRLARVSLFVASSSTAGH